MPQADMSLSEEGWDLPNQSKPKSAVVPAATKEARLRRRNHMITSCLECRRRKLKCDKLVCPETAIKGLACVQFDNDSTHAPIAPSSHGTATSWHRRWTLRLR